MEKEEQVVPPSEETKPPEADTPPAGEGSEDGEGGQAPAPEDKKEEPKDIRTLRRKAEAAEKFLSDQGYEIDPATQSVRKKPDAQSAPPATQDVSQLMDQKLEEYKSAEREIAVQKEVDSELTRLSMGDDKLKESIKSKFESFKGDKQLTAQQARELVYDAYVVVGDSKSKRVSSFMKAGSGGGGGQGGSYTPDERTANVTEKIEWLRNTAGYKFKNKDQNDLISKLHQN